MLIGQHCGRHQHSHLFAICSRLEGSTHRHLGLAEAHITTHQTIHGLGLFHIGLHVLRGLQLIGGILIQETGFELVLQIGIGTEGKALFTTTLGVELDQVAGDVLDMLLRTLLQALPLACAEGGETRRLSIILRLVFRHLIERVDGYVDRVAILIDDLDHLLVTIPLGHAHQSCKLTHPMIHMHHVVANLELLDLLQREGHLTTARLVALQVVLMETVEDLVVGKDTDVQVVIDKTLVESILDGIEGYFCLLGKNIFQSLILLLTVGTDVDLVALGVIVGEGLLEQIEVLMEEGLDGGVKIKS